MRPLAASLLLAALAACAPPPAPAPPPRRAPAPEVDICVGSPPVPREHVGILRDARCDQDMYATMAAVNDQLGVECTHCHVAKGEKPEGDDFLVPTPRAAVANWMSMHLMQAVKPADGSKLRCRSCHTDERGQPVAKILGDKRDKARANEWMSLVLVRKFVAADGSKLKCRSCHVATPGTPGYEPKLILKSERLPPHREGGKGTPAF